MQFKNIIFMAPFALVAAQNTDDNNNVFDDITSAIASVGTEIASGAGSVGTQIASGAESVFSDVCLS